MDQAQQLRNIIKKQQLEPTPSISNTSRVITITSGKGGVGKSNISVNLAIQLRKLGKKVVIMDVDFGLANVEVMLGIRPKYTFADLIFKGKGIRDIITPGPEGIGFISGGSGIQELANLTKEQIGTMSQSLCELDAIADIIIIDTGAGIADSVTEFVRASQEILLVVTPEPTSITDAYALLKMLSKNKEIDTETKEIKMLANRVSSYKDGRDLFNKLSVVVNKFLSINVEYFGAIPQDEHVPKAVIQQKPFSILYPNTTATIAVQELASMLVEKEVGKQQNKMGIAKLFSNLLRSKSRK